MAHKAPGKSHRKGITLIELTRMFPDDAAAERWFVEQRWPDGVHCPDCGSVNVQERETRKPQPYRCRDCRKDFSTKTGTLMQGSNLGFQTWAMAIYLFNTSLKGVSSMKLHPRPGHHPEDRLASGAPHSGDMAGQCRIALRRAGRGR